MRIKLHPICAAVAGSFVFQPMLVWAQSAPAATPAQLPEVTVKADVSRELGAGYNPPNAVSATKTEAPLRDVPQTVNVVTAEVMRDQHATSMQDALKNVPGVSFSHGDGQRDQVSIRGFTAIADQFVDGIRDDALYFRDMSNVDRVEVIKGPAAVLYGRGSSGGLINRVTKKPGIDVTDFALSYGMWADRRAEADVGRVFADGAAAFRVTGAVEKANSYRSQQFLDRAAIAPSLELRVAPETTVLFQADYLEDRRVTDFGIPAYRGRPVDVPASRYYGAANARDADYSQSRVFSGTATINHRFNENWSIRNATRYYHYSLDRNNTLTAAVNEAARTLTMNHGNVRREEHGWFNQTDLIQKATIFGTKHEILYGMEIGQQNKDQINNTKPVPGTFDLFNPVLPVLPRQAPGNPTTSNLGIFDTLAFYTQDMITLSEQWKALVGVRYDNFQQETKNRIAGQRDLSRSDSAWSPRAGLVWQPSKTQSYYVSWSKSFQPSGEAFALAANNADLSPESTRNTEVGAKYDWLNGKASTTISLFRLERSNIKVANATNTALLPIGEQRTDGVELSGAAELGSGWRMLAGYAYLDATITKSSAALQGKRATITPRHSGNLWVTKDLGHGFGVGLGANLVGARYADPQNTVTLPGYVTADAMAWYRRGAFEAQLNVYNLFDKGYIVSAHGTNANLNMPGAPRSVMATLRYRM
ncbi:putative tonB-dependent receptor [Cupriavidus taiwanensis]|uniref:TonB-dependent receptor n=1 Tax=Cupriavidus taiwanensis TaxID=164546 RepID=A0A976AWW9_9BURK|nr:TonB-dependent siderophore receptor [Cupriavidus taiwanensis]SOZ55845.1 putative tonB-dependent receptor [Cupriavidus taiwanensis]SOZ57290.1 putative tonB-dependent receptor [Cupriavidus taiwanensis]SOZ59703.1 putative tonB-dependent receptor [Cupriavidus taiwanensis]SPA05794.1 putative tonB-dependent receptor [Cupriavidus taiwanensis]SPA12405.1 putative tonB-dependent receptor [Cupriavidus taiwanensis]